MKRVALFILGASCILPLGCGAKKVAEKPPLIESNNRVVMIQPPDNPSASKPYKVLSPSDKDLKEEAARVKSLEPITPDSSSNSTDTKGKNPSPALAPASEPAPKPDHLKKDSAGFQYQDIIIGGGKSPTKGQTVHVNYTGWLADGKQFDSSKGRAPFSFQLGMRQVIKGWDLGVAKMKVGGRRILVLPPDLAYGPAGSPPSIPPNATLTFEVELLNIGVGNAKPE